MPAVAASIEELVKLSIGYQEKFGERLINVLRFEDE